MENTFIYALKELKPGEFFSTKIRYIGKANDPYARFEEHCRTKEKNHRGNWIRSLPKRGLQLQLEILDEVPDVKSVWSFWEREYIRVFKAVGFDLVNGSLGGDGGSPMLGKKHSLKTLAKMSAAKKGEKCYWFGKKFSPAHCAKNGAAHLGKKLPPEACKKISAAILGKKHRDNSSGFVGVSWSGLNMKWDVRFRNSGKRIYIGQFEKLEDAVFAHALAREKYERVK